MTATLPISQCPNGQAIQPVSAGATISLDGCNIGLNTPKDAAFNVVSASALFTNSLNITNLKATTVSVNALFSDIITVSAGKFTTVSANSPINVNSGGTGISTVSAYSLLCGGTTNTGAFQGVSTQGTSGQVLTSNGTNALPTWQSASSSSSIPNSGYVTGRYYAGYINNTSGATPTLIADTLYGMPFIVGATTTFTGVSINVDTTGTATTARLGIYNMANGIPTSLVLDCGTVAVGTTGTKEAAISQSLSVGGPYALVAVFNGTCTVKGTTAQANLGAGFLGSSTHSGTVGMGWTGTLTFGALPGTYPSATIIANSGDLPLIELRR